MTTPEACPDWLLIGMDPGEDTTAPSVTFPDWLLIGMYSRITGNLLAALR